MSKTAIKQAIIDFNESLFQEKEVINHANLYNPNDVKQANLIVSVTENIIRKLENNYLELEKKQMLDAVLFNVTKNPKFRILFENQFEQYYNLKFKDNEK